MAIIISQHVIYKGEYLYSGLPRIFPGQILRDLQHFHRLRLKIARKLSGRDALSQKRKLQPEQVNLMQYCPVQAPPFSMSDCMVSIF